MTFHQGREGLQKLRRDRRAAVRSVPQETLIMKITVNHRVSFGFPSVLLSPSLGLGLFTTFSLSGSRHLHTLHWEKGPDLDTENGTKRETKEEHHM